MCTNLYLPSACACKTYVPLSFCICHCNGRRKRLVSKFQNLPGFHQPLNGSFNMKFHGAI